MKKSLGLLLIIFSLWGCQKDEDTPTPTISTTDDRAVYIGIWDCNESSEIYGNSTYPVVIDAHSTINNRITISNFYNQGESESIAQAEIDGNNITLFSQNVNGVTVMGSGSLNNQEITLSFTADDGAGPDNVTQTLNKN